MGIFIKEIDELDIVIEKNVEFDIGNKEEYIKQFKELINNGCIREDTEFFADKWIITIGGVERSIVFPNDLAKKSLSKLFEVGKLDFEIAYRSFIILNIYNPFSIIGFNKNMKTIAKSFKNAKVDLWHKGCINKFIEYIKISEKNYEIFQEIFDNIEFKETGERILPEFEYIFLFSDIISDIIENKSLVEYRDYFLTILWWKICSVLPLRSSEFLRTKFDCIYSENNKFYIKVRRSKGKLGKAIRNISKVDEYYIEDIVNIDEKIFNFILEYQRILRHQYGYNGEELFPYILIKMARNIGGNVNNLRKLNQNIITEEDLRNNVNCFYKYVVEEEYGFKAIPKYIKKEKEQIYIEKLTPYDARHIAIINLILLGTDILEVMYLAGHSNVNTAYSYFNHVNEFSKAYAIGYAKSVLSKKVKDEGRENLSKINQKGSIDFERILNAVNKSKYEPIKVKGGYCCYPHIGNDKSYCHYYERNHVLCKFFTEDNKEVIVKEIQNIEDELDADIKVLFDLIKDMDEISKFNELYQTVSYNISKKIHELSFLNAKIMEE